MTAAPPVVLCCVGTGRSLVGTPATGKVRLLWRVTRDTPGVFWRVHPAGDDRLRLECVSPGAKVWLCGDPKVGAVSLGADAEGGPPGTFWRRGNLGKERHPHLECLGRPRTNIWLTAAAADGPRAQQAILAPKRERHTGSSTRWFFMDPGTAFPAPDPEPERVPARRVPTDIREDVTADPRAREVRAFFEREFAKGPEARDGYAPVPPTAVEAGGVPAEVAGAYRHYQATLAEDDIGGASVYTVPVGGAATYAVIAGTDGADGFLEVYDAGGGRLGVGRTYYEFILWGEPDAVRLQVYASWKVPARLRERAQR